MVRYLSVTFALHGRAVLVGDRQGRRVTIWGNRSVVPRDRDRRNAKDITSIATLSHYSVTFESLERRSLGTLGVGHPEGKAVMERQGALNRAFAGVQSPVSHLSCG